MREAIGRDTTAEAAMDLDQPAFFQDPYPYYAAMRERESPFWLAHAQDNSTSEGIWLFSRYADALTIFKQTAAVSKNIRSVRPPGWSTVFDLHVLHRDGADHLRLRRMAAAFFSGERLAREERQMTAIAESLLSELRRSGEGDLIADVAEPMPLYVIAGLVGVPPEDMPAIRAWSLDLCDGFDSLLATPAVLARQREALGALLDYLRWLIETKRNAPDDSLISHLLAAEGGGTLDAGELLAMLGFLLFAGHETTINLIGNGLYLLLSDEAAWAQLLKAPDGLPDAVEEVLRFESPEQRTSFRIAAEPLEVNGTRIEPGQQLGVVIGAANRDPQEFAAPDRFDIRRTPNRHVAFGLGLHACLGKTLARTEARIALGAALRQVPSLRLQATQPTWRRNSFFRGLTTLPARVG